MSECKRVLKEDGTIYVCCDWKSSVQVYNIMNKYFILKNRITREREK
jgi:site-specific DNA-methyltransferase (adenine-specific)